MTYMDLKVSYTASENMLCFLSWRYIQTQKMRCIFFVGATRHFIKCVMLLKVLQRMGYPG